MSLLDVLTGGKSDEATDALRRAEDLFANLKTPTLQDLTLPELEKLVEAGIMTPAQAQAALQERNAYADQNIDQTGTAAQISALNQLAGIANAGAEGTPMEQAQLENAISKMNTSVGGQRGAIENAMAARGTPTALIQAALENQIVGQEGQQAHMDAVNAAGNTYQTALNALAGQGSLGGSLQGQQNAQANQVAAAQNAMQQFNAANQQQNSQFNAANTQQANAYNAQNRQNISNQNVGNKNYRTEYNAKLPQQMYENEYNKAAGAAGAATNYGKMQQEQGRQIAAGNAGIINALAPGVGNLVKGFGGTATNGVSGPTANAPVVPGEEAMFFAHGGEICLDDGGMVPGEASVAGDSLANDTVPIHASPGEVVLPRSSVAEHPDEAMALLNDQDPGPQIDFQDVATLLKALRSIRLGVA